MQQLDWGFGIGLKFTDESDYYECLGYIANTNHPINVYTHKNDVSGAWAGQGKLHIHTDVLSLPNSLQKSFKISGDNRLSVSDYVENLIKNHGFSNFMDPTGNRYTYYRYPNSLNAVLQTVPVEYQQDFFRGYNM